MNSAVTKRAGDVFPVVENLPNPSRELSHAMREAIDLCRGIYASVQSVPRPDGGYDWFYSRMPKPSLIEEARNILPILRQAASPATAELRERWLLAIVAAVHFPPTREDYVARLSAFHIAAEGIPAIAFNRVTLQEIMRRHKYFPSCHELVAVLQQAELEHSQRCRDVERIANARPNDHADAARQHFLASQPGRYPHHPTTPPSGGV